MRIENRGADLQRVDRVREIRPVTNEAPERQASPSRADRVQISETGRALAQQHLEETSGGEGTSELTPARVAQIRTRILEGAYNSLEVVEQVARRMLTRGDI